MSNYRIEFPKYDDVIMLPNDWIDSSWHNDVSPSFETHIDQRIYKLWCDFKDPDKREVGGKQFTLMSSEYDEDIVDFEFIAEFDTLEEALEFFNKEIKQ